MLFNYNMIQFEANSDTLISIDDIDGLDISDHGVQTLGPDQYQVGAAATDAAIAELQQRGVQLNVIADANEMGLRFSQMLPRASSVAISTQLQLLQTACPDQCTFGLCPDPTVAAGTLVPYVRIAGAAPVSRLPILFTGGVHAREWAPPEALLSFAARLCAAAATTTDSLYPTFSQPQPTGLPVDFPSFLVPASLIQAILDRVELYIAPNINPDGRDFSLSMPYGVEALWRKNRSPTLPSVPPCIVNGLDMSVGVDINRNADIVWDFDGTYFDSAAAARIKTSNDPCKESYRGPFVLSEPEAKNIQWLQTNFDVVHHVDVHSWGREIVCPWGFATDQTNDNSKNFQNPNLHHLRDPTYREFVPAPLLQRLFEVGDFMRDAILRTKTADSRAGATRHLQSDYTVNQGYPASGEHTGFHFGRQFSVGPAPSYLATTTPPERLAYTIECGDPSENHFWPDLNDYLKIEREVHAALWGFLASVLFPTMPVSATWPFI